MSANLGRAILEIATDRSEFDKGIQGVEADSKSFVQRAKEVLDNLELTLKTDMFTGDLKKAESDTTDFSREANRKLSDIKVDADISGFKSDISRAEGEADSFARTAHSKLTGIDVDADISKFKGDMSKGEDEAKSFVKRAQAAFDTLKIEAEDKASPALDKLKEKIGEVSGATGFGSLSPSALLAGGGIAAGLAVGSTALLSLFNSAVDAQKQIGQLQAEFGLTKTEAEKLNGLGKSIFQENFGESIGEVNKALATVQQNFKGLDEEKLTQVTKEVLTLKNVFGLELNETMKVSSTLAKNFKIDASDALDLITTGFQKGGNKADDLLDTLNEYSTQFSRAGFKANEFLEVLINGLDKGAFNADKVADSVKEFTIRVQDGSDSTRAAFKDLGLDADAIARKLGDGSLSVKGLMEIVNSKLRQSDDKVRQNIDGVALYGTQWEDLGSDAILNLDKIENKLGDVKGATDKAGKAVSDNLGTQWDAFTRKASDSANAVLTPALKTLNNNLDDLNGRTLPKSSSSMNDFSAGLVNAYNGTTKASDAQKTHKETQEELIASTKSATHYTSIYASAMKEAGQNSGVAAGGTATFAEKTGYAKKPLDDAALATQAWKDKADEAARKLKDLTLAVNDLRDAANENKQAINGAKSNLADYEEVISRQPKKVQDLWNEMKTYSEKASEGGTNTDLWRQKAEEAQKKIEEIDPKLRNLTEGYDRQNSAIAENTKKWDESIVKAAGVEGKQADVAKQVKDNVTPALDNLNNVLQKSFPFMNNNTTAAQGTAGAFGSVATNVNNATTNIQTYNQTPVNEKKGQTNALTMKQEWEAVRRALQDYNNTPVNPKNAQLPKSYATGTSYHPGGAALVGEAGAEFVRFPGGKMSLLTAPTFFPDLAKGAQVFNADETRRMLERSLPAIGSSSTSSQTNNYNLHLNTTTPAHNVQDDFKLMKTMWGN